MTDFNQLKNEFNDVSEFLVAIGDETRQTIIITLIEHTNDGGLRVNDLTEATGLSRPAISHHLKILKQSGLVSFRSEGTKNFYYLSHDTGDMNKLSDLLDNIRDCIVEAQNN